MLLSMDTPILKGICIRLFLKYQFRDGRLQSVCQFLFIQLSFLFVNTPIVFPEMQHALRLAIIYHAIGQNTRTKIQKDVFLSKMPLDKGSAAMSFEIGFKGVGFFFVFKGNHIFDAPRFLF